MGYFFVIFWFFSLVNHTSGPLIPRRVEGDIVFYKFILSVGGVDVPPQVCARNYFDGRWPGEVPPKVGASVRIKIFWCLVTSCQMCAHRCASKVILTPMNAKDLFFHWIWPKVFSATEWRVILVSSWSYLLVSGLLSWNTCAVFYVLPLFHYCV